MKLGRPSTPNGGEGRDELCHGFQYRIGRRPPNLGLGFDQLPDAAFVVKVQRELLILLIASNNAELGAAVRSLLLLQDERTVRSAEQPIRAGDHIEAVLDSILRV